jgi:hypothetical protein
MPIFGQSSPNRCRAKKHLKYYIKAQFEIPEHLNQTTIKVLNTYNKLCKIDASSKWSYHFYDCYDHYYKMSISEAIGSTGVEHLTLNLKTDGSSLVTSTGREKMTKKIIRFLPGRVCCLGPML